MACTEFLHLYEVFLIIYRVKKGLPTEEFADSPLKQTRSSAFRSCYFFALAFLNAATRSFSH